MKISQFFRKIVYPKSENEDLRRREFILNVLLSGSIIFLIIANVITIVQSITLGSAYRGMSPLLTLAILFVFILFLYLARIGFFVLTSYIFIGVYFALATYMIYRWGVQVPSGLLFYSLIIIISGILISARFAFIIALISSLTLLFISYLQINNIIIPNLYWKDEVLDIVDIIVLIIIFGIIATVSWLSNREIEKSLNRARKSEAELKQERDLLEVRVEERTKELKKMQMEKISQLYRFAEFGRLSTGLFHDLINPLTALSLNIEQVKNIPNRGIAKTESYLNRALEAAKRMENFIIAIRKQMSQRENKTLFSATEEINQAIQVLDYKARKADVRINFFSPVDVQIYGDEIKFNQIITNLITNAVDAYTENERKKEVVICLKEKNDIINLSVEDWGCGIAKEFIDKIFQPFFSTKSFKQGTGIGLSLVKTIVEKDFRGAIEVESEKDKGSKFTIKFPKNKEIKTNKTMNNYPEYLIREQQEDGSFLDSFGSKSILFTALMLSCLKDQKETDEIKNVKQKAVDFLLSQKNDNWLFSTNTGINFCVLSALLEYNSEIIDGAAIAKILMFLTSIEEKQGGPYYSDISKQDKKIDLGVNVAIAYFLSLQNVNLPELDNLIESAIENNDFQSKLFRTCEPIIYFISKFYKGAQKEKLINFILEKRGETKNQFDNLLAETALNNLKHKEIKTTLEKVKDEEEIRMMDAIIKVADKRFSLLQGEIRNYALKQIQRTIKGNPNKQMPLMPYYFKKALGKKGQRISDEMVARLGLANIFFWTAFIIYDDFIDEEGDPKIISTANLFARGFTTFFNTLFTKDSEFNYFFRKLMDKLDAANTWEAVNCRTKVSGSKIEIPQSVPVYGNYDLAYEPSSAHILGPVAMLYYLDYQQNSSEVQNLISYFRNYLIAMQVNDDAHDWKEDLERGHLSAVVVMLLKDYQEKYPDKKEIDMEKDLSELQKIFWFKTIVSAAKTAVWHTDKSRQALEAMTILEDISPLERFIIITENVAKKALKEQKTTMDFLSAYKEG